MAVHLTIGLIADIQYADKDDATNWDKTRTRYYRGALDSLKRAVAAWKKCTNLACVVQVGDLIDGVNKRIGGEETVAASLNSALEPFKGMPCTTYHMIGNHDLYNLTRSQVLTSELNSARLPGCESVKGELYYSVVLHPRLRLVVLDTYDVAVLGYSDCPDHPRYKEAQEILNRNNPNEEKSDPTGLEGADRRFASYNGGVGEQQLAWLDAQLTEADAKRQNVLITGHCQVNPVLTTLAGCLLWNYEEVQRILHARNCVIGCIFGHDHDGSLTTDAAGLKHLVLNGVIETAPDTDAYATAFLHDQTLDIEGAGVVPSVSFQLKYFVNDKDDGGGEKCGGV